MPDRIQSALAKARARRAALERAQAGAMASGQGAPGQTPEAENLDPKALWQSLPEITCTPRQFLQSRLLAHTSGDPAAPFDQLRNRVLRELRAQGWRRLGVTSPDEGSGRSTVAANLALSLARNPDLRILLVEADLHHPALARMLGLRSAPQFSEALRGALPLKDGLLRLGANLCLAFNAAPVADAAELLQHPGLPATLDRLQAMLAPDVIIFDLPAMLSGDAALAFLDKVDCALLVAAADATSLPDLETCNEELARHTHSLGVVLNKLRLGGGS